MLRLFLLIATAWLMVLGSSMIFAQHDWQMLETGTKASLRGLAVVDAKTVWASGSDGTVLRTIDGEKFTRVSPAGYEQLDFRSLVAFSDQEAVIASAGERDVILRTTDGGKSWSLVFEHAGGQAFFDGMVFWDREHGILMGDPLESRVYLLVTKDGGQSWKPLGTNDSLTVEDGEAGFAASNSNLCTVGENGLLIALGGAKPGESSKLSHVMWTEDRGSTWSRLTVPMPRGESAGIFSLAALGRRVIAVGGDYKQEKIVAGNIAISIDIGRTWIEPGGPAPRGYRSAVTMTDIGGQLLAVAVGPSGCDFSRKGGEDWQPLSDTGFHSARFSPDGSALWASGSNGRIGKLTVQSLLNK
jgi:photosystem II stability/assembly factor-like uncharacterized protein